MEIRKSKIKWKNSYLVGITLALQKRWDKMKIEERIIKRFGRGLGELIYLFIALGWVIYVVLILLLIQFIESPIRKLIFKGKAKDKFNEWIDVWKSAYFGAVGRSRNGK